MNNLQPHTTWKVIDSSKIQDAMDCEREFMFRHIFGWKSTRPNNHLHFGTSWHKAQEYLLLNGYETRNVLKAYGEFERCYREEFDEDTDALYGAKTPANALVALNDYAQRFSSDHSEYEVLYTEISGSVMLTEDILLYFKLDSILRDLMDNMILSFEHKTGSREGRQWTDQWLLRCQMNTYTHVMKCLYEPEEVKGVLVRGTFFKKSGITFQEVPLWKGNETMQVWAWNTIQWVDRINHNIEMLMQCSDDDAVLMAFPMNPENCTKYFGCAYHDFCTAWPNPLRNCEEPPMGFEVEFWDPREEETTHKMDVK